MLSATRVGCPHRATLPYKGFLAFKRRSISGTRPQRDIEQPLQLEQHEISTMDGLLRVGRARADPAQASSMPMRSPMLWSEALLQPDITSVSGPASSMPNMSPRPMHASYSEILLPFASSPELLEKYTNASGGIRTGKLLEHLDSLAGSIAYKHVLGADAQYNARTSGFYIVTAAVDRLDMLAPLMPVRDLRLSGQVIYTGKSSMEVAVKMEAVGHNQEAQTLMLGRFAMVCRDARTHRARPIPGLALETAEDKALYAIGETHKNRRQSLAQRSLERVPPSSEEAAMLHDFYLQYGQDNAPPVGLEGEERVWMGDTKIEKCMLMFPQERNIHQKIFGGYLMRLAYELGFTNTRLFTRAPVRFLALDRIAFARPVPIGSILRLRSQILHSDGNAHVHVGVQANVVDVETGLEQTTNDFRFTWTREREGPRARMVVPRTYREAMLWLEAKRNLEIGAELRGMRH